MNQIKKTTPASKAEVVNEPKQSTDIVAQEKTIVKTEADIDGFIELRQKFIAKVNAICVEGKDYHVIQGKKSLAKGGAEKIASIFKWTAKFDKDVEALEMLGIDKGLVAFKCTLANGGFVGEGRGAASLAKNNGDPNKTLKMAQKSAFIDAVLRASGLSDFFTQDLGPEDEGGTYGHLDKKPFDKKEYIAPNGQSFTETKYSLDEHLSGEAERMEKDFRSMSPKLPQPIKQRKPTEKQAAFIKELCSQKKVTQTQLVEMAKGKNPSQLIETLLAYHPTENKEELPVIQQMSEEEQALADSVPF